MSRGESSTENLFKNIQDFSSVLKDLSLNIEYPCVGAKQSPGDTNNGSISPARSSLGLLPPETFANMSVADSLDGSISFPAFNLGSNKENNAPSKRRYEIESGILDEDGETDLELFLDNKDIKALDAMYTPSGTDTDEEPPSSHLVSSGEELAKPLELSAADKKDENLFIRPLPPSLAPTPRSFARPKPNINTPVGVPSALLAANYSLNNTDNQDSPKLPPRIPVGWGQFESLMENSSAHQSWNDSSQLSFNGSGYPWEKLIPKHPSIQTKSRIDEESELNDPLDPSFCSGKISARSTSLGPTGEIGNSTRDENFSDFSRPANTYASSSGFSQYSGYHKDENDSVFYSGFPPHQAFNPFDDMDNMVQAQDSDEFQEFDQVGEKGLTEFLDQEEKECLEKNQFLEEEPMEEPQNTSGFSGISDQSIVLRNNRLWAGDTSGVNLEKLREETRLSRCEYFRHNSSRLGSLEDSIPEGERPVFGFVHKIRSPEHRPQPLLDGTFGSSNESSRATYSVGSNSQSSHRLTGLVPGISSISSTEKIKEYQGRNSETSQVHQGRLSGESGGSGSGQSSAETTYMQSGESTKTVVSLCDQSGTLKAEDLADRLEALADQLGSPVGPNVSYPDVVEDSLGQDRELEKSLQALVEGEINLKTISRALSDASLSSDPQHFVNLIRNSLKAKLENEEKSGSNLDKMNIEDKSLDSMLAEHCIKTLDEKFGTSRNSILSQRNHSPATSVDLTTTPKNTKPNSLEKVRRNLSDVKTIGFRNEFTGSLEKLKSSTSSKHHLSSSVNPISKHNSVSEPPTPRDTPTPPLLSKSSSVPYNLDNSRRRRASATRHSSPIKKSPKKTVPTNRTPLTDLNNLLHEAETTPSLYLSSRKHLHTSTPFHPNLNLSTVILDNLTRNKSISPLVNPDLSINAVNLDVSTVSPDFYTSLHVPQSVGRGGHAPVRPVTSAAQISEPYFQKLYMTDFESNETFSSHSWNKLQVPIIHNLTFEVQALIKVSKIWIGSLDIPEEFWKNVLNFNSETLVTVNSDTKFVELDFFAKREGAFALNLGLVSPGGLSSTGMARFQVEEPNLRVLTRNGQSIDFGTVPTGSVTSVPIMLVNGGTPDLQLYLELVSSSSIFSFSQSNTEKILEFQIPGTKGNGKEAVAKEIKVWGNAGHVPEYSDPRVYAAKLIVKLGSATSEIILGTIEILFRVCFSKLVLPTTGIEQFTCISGEKGVQTIQVSAQGSLALEVEVSTANIPEGRFMFEKRFQLAPGSVKPLSLEFNSYAGFYGKRSIEFTFTTQPGNIVHKLHSQINIIPKAQASIFSSNNPGLKLGVMGGGDENLERFPVEADRSLINWFAVEPGRSEEQVINLRNSSNSTVVLNIMIRDADCFKISGPVGLETSTKLVFAPKETKILNLVFSPNMKSTFKGKLVLKPQNMKVGGKIIKASLNLVGSAGSSDIQILDLKSVSESSYLVIMDKEPPTRREFRITNTGSSPGFVKILCTEEIGRKSSKVQISPDCFILSKGETKIVTVNFSSEFHFNSATLLVFFGPEIVRNVYRRAKTLPGAARLSGSPALHGVDFSVKFPREEEITSAQFSGDLTGEDVMHLYNKTEKHTIKIQLPEKVASFDELTVEETLSETRLNATSIPHSPPTTDTVRTRSQLQISPSVVSLNPGTESIVKISNLGSSIVHWDLSWSSGHLTCSPPAGQLAPRAQAILLISTRQDISLDPQGWKGQVEIYSDHAVDIISVFIKPANFPVHKLVVNPTLIEFGNVVVGSQDRRTVNLSNPTADLVQWRGCIEPSYFSLGQPNGLLNPSQTVCVPIIFKPEAPGATRAVLDFTLTPLRGGKDGITAGPPVSSVLQGVGVSLQYLDQVQTQPFSSIDASRADILPLAAISYSKPNLRVPTSVNLSNVTQPVSLPPQPGSPSHLLNTYPVSTPSRQDTDINLGKTTGAKKPKGTLSLEKENILFEAAVGRTQALKVMIKNRTPENQFLKVFLEPGSPFLIIHETLEVKSQSFSRFPVQFKPIRPGRFGAHLRVSSASGLNLVATLSGFATINPGDSQLSLSPSPR